MAEPPDRPSPGKGTAGVKTLFGDPRKAIIKLAIPMMVAMSVQTIYNIVDAFWVAGLGADALAAMGFVFPFFFVIMSLSNGLGIGGGAAISRRIGAKDKTGADNVAVHTIVMMVLLAAIFSVPFFLLARDIFVLMGASGTTELAVAYARIIFAGSIIIFFVNVASAILRSEGDAKRAMYVMVLGAGLNIVLDPIFIYTLGMGIEGAAWATLISLGVSSVIMSNWLFFRKNTYVVFKFSGFRFDWSIVRDISRVGLPASVQQLSMAITTLIITVLIVMVNSTDGVAVYSVGWRIATIAIAPLIGIATAVVTVTGAAFGKHSFKNVQIAHTYATKVGLVIEVIIAVATFVFAPHIAAIFTYTEGAAHIAPALTTFLRIISIFYPTVSLGMLSSSMFQGVGRGTDALVVTLLRTLVLTPIFAILFAFTLEMGLVGIWWGLVAGNVIGSVVAFIWARLYVSRLTIFSQKIE
ncbi:MAG: MATE family efflux transporter [Methanosarcinales archaeon]|nr:MATE family efflux transporter [Methanosarcinales archaeon]